MRIFDIDFFWPRPDGTFYFAGGYYQADLTDGKLSNMLGYGFDKFLNDKPINELHVTYRYIDEGFNRLPYEQRSIKNMPRARYVTTQFQREPLDAAHA